MATTTSLSIAPILSPAAPATSGTRRDAVLRAALELFAERTYGAAPVPEIAARAQVGAGTVYRHFQSKEALANVVYRRCKGAMDDALRLAMESSGSVQERFLGLWMGLAAMAREDSTAMRFLELQHHNEYLDEESRGVSDAVFARAEKFMREGQESGAMRSGDPAIIISLVFGAFVGLFKESCAGRLAWENPELLDAGQRVWRMIASS